MGTETCSSVLDALQKQIDACPQHFAGGMVVLRIESFRALRAVGHLLMETELVAADRYALFQRLRANRQPNYFFSLPADILTAEKDICLHTLQKLADLGVLENVLASFPESYNQYTDSDI